MERRHMLQTLGAGAAALLTQLPGAAAEVDARTGAQLLRKRYDSKATGQPREYYLYLPVGYQSETGKKWPVMMFLHGGGERGNGLDDLKYTLMHGPLMEAWIQGRDLPFIIINPQLPLFDRPEPKRDPLPERTPEGTAPPRPYGSRPSQPMARETPEIEPRRSNGLPQGWETLEDELLAMVDNTLADYRADDSPRLPHRAELRRLRNLVLRHPPPRALGGGVADLRRRRSQAGRPHGVAKAARLDFPRRPRHHRAHLSLAGDGRSPGSRRPPRSPLHRARRPRPQRLDPSLRRPGPLHLVPKEPPRLTQPKPAQSQLDWPAKKWRGPPAGGVDLKVDVPRAP